MRQNESIKNVIFPLFLVFLIALTSGLNYFGLKRSYWGTELPPFIFGASVSLLGAGLLGATRLPNFRVAQIDIAFVFFYAYICLHSVLNAWPYPSTDQLYVPVGILVFYVLVRVGMGDHLPRLSGVLALGIISIAGFQAILGLAQHGGMVPYFHPLYRAAGSFVNPGIYGCFLSLGLCTAFGRVLDEGYRRKIPLVAFALLIAVALVLSGSRTAWISTGIGMSFVVISRYPGPLANLKIRRGLLICGAFLFLGGTYLLLEMNRASVGGRMLIWKVGWQMFLEQPLFGHGYGGFYTGYGNYQSAYFLSGTAAVEEMQTAGMNYYAFNEPLKIMVEQGMVGLVLFALVVAITFAFALKRIGAEGRTSQGLITFVAIALVVLVFGCFSYPFQDISIGLLFALSMAYIAARQSVEAPIQIARLSGLFRILAFGCLVFFGFRSFEKIRAILVWKHAKENILVQEGDALRDYVKAYAVLPNNGAFLFNYGAELVDMGNYAKALGILERAGRYGNSIELHLKTARAHIGLGRYDRAEEEYIRAAHMNPKLFVPFYELLLFYDRIGQVEKARGVAAMIRDKPVKVPSETIGRIKEFSIQYLKKNE
ncbi:O-antigen ligase family protein [Olivibacter sitiensis]|uniref:O-antigen ligase family protein n=1 Tax=Olivibacter sitiensis TaxID=376470 RepID=UPI0004871B92|nr:O-antigen ligase family protein [Olivibacter sitiensis]